MSINRAKYLTTLALLLVAFVTTASAQADQIVYDDALENGWQSYGWASNLSYTATSPVHTGNDSIMVGCTAGYQAVFLHHDAFNTSAYTNLTFWLYRGNNPGSLYVQAIASATEGAQPGVLLSSFSTNAWQQITLTWNSLGVANTSIDGFWIQSQVNGPDLFYIDDIKLTAVPPPPQIAR